MEKVASTRAGPDGFWRATALLIRDTPARYPALFVSSTNRRRGTSPVGEKMKRILVGVDGSTASRDAAKFAAEMAGPLGAQLVIVSAVWPVVDVDGAPELVARAFRLAVEEREYAHVMVKEMATSLAAGVTVETLVTDGSPAVALADLAQAGDVEMVVVGHRGRNAVARALLGSVADRLVQICPKPVLVVR